MPVANLQEPTPPCSHLLGAVEATASHTTGYQPIWHCKQCGQDIRLEDLLEPWSQVLQDLTKRVSSLEAYWDQDLSLSGDPDDGR